MSNDHAPGVKRLSDAGLERRERMLDELLGEMQRVHRNRRVRRRAALIAIPAVLIAVTIAWQWLPLSHIGEADSNSVARVPTENPGSRSDPAIAPPTSVVVSVVRTSETVLDRYRASSPPHAHTITDDELLETLAALDRPTGIIRAGERVWLTRPVSDDPHGGV
jgi:hypothetical protein